MTRRTASAANKSNAASRSGTRRTARRSSFKKRLKTFLALSFLLVETVVATALFCGLLIFWNYSVKLPKVEELTTEARPPVPTTVVSSDGVVLAKLDVENRQPIALNEIPKRIQDATVAIEDHRFYEHPGVDVWGICRAGWANLRGGNPTGQGGSTLTQQLVRNMPQFGVSRERRLERKLQEAIIAMRLEQIYSKQEILERYLNVVYYGGGAYGIQAAAKTFFGKPVARLDISESALLAGLPQRPTSYTPFEHRRAALKRRDEVLQAMLTNGYITPEQCRHAMAEHLYFMHRPKHRFFASKAPYFTNYVLGVVYKKYGVEYVESGLRIETSLDYKEQLAAEHAMNLGWQNAAFTGANQGAFVAIDPHTGYIRAMVGGRDYRADEYNAVTQGKRQPGSTFKAFDYSAAFDTGTATLKSTYVDKPVEYPNDPKHRVVKNFSPGYSYHRIDCLTAIKHSMNTIAVQVAQDVGIKTVIAYAHKMGITTELAPYLPTALGASAVRPLDLCSAYSLFANGGNRCRPMAVLRIVDADNNIIEDNQPEIETNILKPETLQQMDTAFEAVVTSGTGTRARGTEENGIVENARGKTGTTSDLRDAWFAGYTPELTAVIWLANVHRTKHGIEYRTMDGATGGALCAPIWHNFMIAAVPEQRKYNQEHQLGDGQAAMLTVKPVKADDTAKKPLKTALNADKKPDKKPQPPANLDANAPPPEQAPPQTDITPVAEPPSQNSEGLASTPTPAIPAPTDSETGLRVKAPTTQLAPRPAAPRPRPTPKSTSSDLVTIKVCADTGDLATPYCDVTQTRQVTRAQLRRMHRCRLHHPPPGETDQ